MLHPKGHDVFGEVVLVAVGPLLQISFGIDIHYRCILKLITLVEKINGIEFALHTRLFFVGHVLEWHAVGT